MMQSTIFRLSPLLILLAAALVALAVFLGPGAQPAQGQNAPEAPPHVSVYPASDGVALIVRWREVDPPVTGYEVQYKLATAASWTSVPENKVNSPHRYTILSGLNQGTYQARVRAKNDNGESGWTVGSGTLSSSDKDDHLSSLWLRASTSSTGRFNWVNLLSTFRPNLIYYDAVVQDNLTHVKVRPTVRDSRATVTVNGTSVASGSFSNAIAFEDGPIRIVVSSDYTTNTDSNWPTRTYTLTLYRPAKDPSHSATGGL